ncbi:hypothetical protein BJ742DRAFT_134189 [Cladochytrium replicatum]|nr:hypothetical protein BJ742DRAFT_134189 [Cladochytrium replicatum]
MGSSALDEEHAPQMSPVSTTASDRNIEQVQFSSGRPISATPSNYTSTTSPLTSAQLIDDSVSLTSLGLNLHPRYTGPLDPFGVDPLSLLRNNDRSADAGRGMDNFRYESFREDKNPSPLRMGERRSRFEKYFSGGSPEQSNYGFQGREDSKSNQADDFRSGYAGLNPGFGNMSLESDPSSARWGDNYTTTSAKSLEQLNGGAPEFWNQAYGAAGLPSGGLPLRQQHSAYGYPLPRTPGVNAQYALRQALLQQQQQQFLQQQQQAMLGRLQQLDLQQQQQQYALQGVPPPDELLTQFLREAQGKQGPSRINGAAVQNAASLAADLPFRDPAIMSVKMNPGGQQQGVQLRVFDGFSGQGFGAGSDWAGAGGVGANAGAAPSAGSVPPGFGANGEYYMLGIRG